MPVYLNGKFAHPAADAVRASIAMSEGEIGRALCAGSLVDARRLSISLGEYKWLNRGLMRPQQIDRGAVRSRAVQPGKNPVRMDGLIYSDRAPAIRRNIVMRERELGRAFYDGSAREVICRLIVDLADYKSHTAKFLVPSLPAVRLR